MMRILRNLIVNLFPCVSICLNNLVEKSLKHRHKYVIKANWVQWSTDFDYQYLYYIFFQAVDPDLHKSLNWILANDITDVIDSTFSVEHDAFGAIRVHELKPGGKSIQVIHQLNPT